MGSGTRPVQTLIYIILAYDKPEWLVPERFLKAAGFIKSSFEIPACRRPDFADLVKSASGIWLFSVSHLLGLG